MPNLPVPDLPGGTIESTDTVIGVKSATDGSLVLLPLGADQAAQDANIASNAGDIATNAGDIATNAAAIAATEIVADGAVQRSGDAMSGNLDVPSLVVDGGSLIAGGLLTVVGATTVAALTATGGVDMTGAPSVSVPAPTAATQAAQTTAIDATTGQMAINGYEMGDTGWRDVSASLENGYTGTVLIRRSGNFVSVRVALGASAKTADRFYTFTDGFSFDAGGGTAANSGNRAHWAMNNSTSTTDASEWFGPSGASGSGLKTSSSLAANYGEGTFATIAAWPTSLPGTAV